MANLWFEIGKKTILQTSLCKSNVVIMTLNEQRSNCLPSRHDCSTAVHQCYFKSWRSIFKKFRLSRCYSCYWYRLFGMQSSSSMAVDQFRGRHPQRGSAWRYIGYWDLKNGHTSSLKNKPSAAWWSSDRSYGHAVNIHLRYVIYITKLDVTVYVEWWCIG